MLLQWRREGKRGGILLFIFNIWTKITASTTKKPRWFADEFDAGRREENANLQCYYLLCCLGSLCAIIIIIISMENNVFEYKTSHIASFDNSMTAIQWPKQMLV